MGTLKPNLIPPLSPAEKRFNRILEQRALRLGISLGAAALVAGEKPLRLEAAELAAKRLGHEVTPEDVLQGDLKRMEASDYPTPECLTPDEVEDLAIAGFASADKLLEAARAPGAALIGGIAPERIAHLADCDACRTLLLACQPSAEQREQFKQRLQQTLAEGQTRPARAAAFS